VRSFSDQVEQSALQSASNLQLKLMILRKRQITHQLNLQWNEMLQLTHEARCTLALEQEQHKVSQTGKALPKLEPAFATERQLLYHAFTRKLKIFRFFIY
jgi:hypothetical protein